MQAIFACLVLVGVVLARPPIVFQQLDGLAPVRTPLQADGTHHATNQYLHVSARGRHTGLFYNVSHADVVLLDDDARIQSVSCVSDTTLTIQYTKDTYVPGIMDSLGWEVGTILVGSHIMGCQKPSRLNPSTLVPACVYRVITGPLSTQSGDDSVMVVPCRQAQLTELIPSGTVSFYTNDGLTTVRDDDTMMATHGSGKDGSSAAEYQTQAYQAGPTNEPSYQEQGFFSWLWSKITGAAEALWHDITSFSFDKTFTLLSYKFNTNDALTATQNFPFGDVSASLSCSTCFAEFDVTLQLDLEIDDAHVNHMALTLDGSAALSFVVTADLSIELQVGTSTHLTTIDLPDIAFTIGVIPILIQPSLPVDAGISAFVKGEGTAQVGLQLNNDIQVGLAYPQPPSYWPATSDSSSDDGVHVLNYDQGWQVTPVHTLTASVAASLTVYLTVGLDVTVDVILSAGIYAKPSLTLSFTDSLDSNPVLSLDGGLDLYIQGSVFVVAISDPLTLYSTTFNLWKSTDDSGNTGRRLLALPGSHSAVALHGVQAQNEHAAPAARGLHISAKASPVKRVKIVKPAATTTTTTAATTASPNVVITPLSDSTGTVVDVTQCPHSCHGHGQCMLSSATNTLFCACSPDYYGIHCSHRRSDGASKDCSFGSCVVFDQFQTCSHLNGLSLCASSNWSRLVEQDEWIGAVTALAANGQGLYGFMQSQGPVCMEKLVSLLCSQSFPSCDTSPTSNGHTVIKTCHGSCVSTFQACGLQYNDSRTHCDVMSASTQQHMSKSSVTQSCKPLPTISKSECVMASGLSTCSMSNGRYVSLNSLMFNTLGEADAYVAQAVQRATAIGSRFASCPSSATILLCSQFLPQCDSTSGDRVRLCHSTCADAIWNCNFDGVHNFSSACDGVGWSNLVDSDMGDESNSVSSYVANYVAPPVASALDPTASTCGYAMLPELSGVSFSRLTAKPGSACLNPADCSGGMSSTSNQVSDTVFISSMVISVVGALLIGALIGWMMKARSVQKHSALHQDVTLDETPYRPLTSHQQL